MNAPFLPLIDVVLHHARRCHHLAWFLYGCLEREQALNADAYMAWWLRGVEPSSKRLLFPAAGRRIPAPTTSAPRASADNTRPLPVRR